MNLSRKIKRNKMKNQMKCFKKAMKGISKRMDSLGDRCQGCDLAFDNTDADALSTWVVYVVDGTPNVICPDCKKEIFYQWFTYILFNRR